MFGSNLLRNIKEIARYVRNHQYEMGDGGLYFPKARAGISGIYTHTVNGMDERSDRNLIPDEGLVQFLGEVLQNPSAPAHVAAWYVMLHSGTGTPTAALTAANYDATLSEITSGSEGYSEATRVAWAPDATDIVNTEVTNLASPATFTIVTASSLIVNGAGMTSIATKGSTSGVLLSAGKFSTPRTLSNTDEFDLKYKVDFDAI